jgi:hypothetical protein
MTRRGESIGTVFMSLAIRVWFLGAGCSPAPLGGCREPAATWRFALRDLAPRLGVPVLESFCSEVVWGPKIFPLCPQNWRPVRSSRHVLIERKAKSNAGGLVVLLID